MNEKEDMTPMTKEEIIRGKSIRDEIKKLGRYPCFGCKYAKQTWIPTKGTKRPTVRCRKCYVGYDGMPDSCKWKKSE
jgi:hypothetical protein